MNKLKPCPFCGDPDVKPHVHQCDRHGWEIGCEPSITCANCGIGFSTGFFGPGCDPDWIEDQMIMLWNTRKGPKQKKDCSELHELYSDKDALCPVCGEPFDPNF